MARVRSASRTNKMAADMPADTFEFPVGLPSQFDDQYPNGDAPRFRPPSTDTHDNHDPPVVRAPRHSDVRLKGQLPIVDLPSDTLQGDAQRRHRSVGPNIGGGSSAPEPALQPRS